MADNEEVEFMYVESARNDDRVALSEVDDAHPGGSIMVARGIGVVKVANTPAVMDALRARLLREVKNSEGRKKADEAARQKMGDAEAARVEAAMQRESTDPLMNENPQTLGKIAKEEGVDLEALKAANNGKLTKTVLVNAINENRSKPFAGGPEKLTGVNENPPAGEEGNKE